MTELVWTGASPIALAGAAIWARLRSVLRSGKDNKRDAFEGGDESIFVTEFPTLDLRGRARRRATNLALPSLMPLPLDELVVYARPSADRDAVELAAIKKSELASAGAGKAQWIVLSPTWRALTPKGARDAATRNTLFSASFVIAVLGAFFIYVSALTALERRAADLREAERGLRQQAVAATMAKNEAGLWEVLQDRLLRESLPVSILRLQSKLTAATPATAYWETFAWTPKEAVIAGRASDPFDVLEAFAGVDGVGSAQFSKPIEASGGGAQNFEITLTLEDAPK